MRDFGVSTGRTVCRGMGEDFVGGADFEPLVELGAELDELYGRGLGEEACVRSG